MSRIFTDDDWEFLKKYGYDSPFLVGWDIGNEESYSVLVRVNIEDGNIKEIRVYE